MGQLSAENIQHQSDRSKFEAIVQGVRNLRDDLSNRKKPSDEAKEDFQQRVYDQFGIQIKLNIHENFGINAAVIPPAIDRNHIFFNEVQSDILKDKDARKKLKKTEKLYGEIDMVNAKVSGVFSEIESEFLIGTPLLVDKSGADSVFEDEEIASIMCHEIGHLFTFYEYLTRSVIVNLVLGDLAQEFADASSHKQKVEITKAAGKAMELEALEPEVVAEAENKTTFQTWVISKQVHQKHHLTKTPVYDFRNCEAMADQFVARLGAHREMVEGLDRLFRISGATTHSRAQAIAVSIVNNLILLIPLVVAFPVGILLLIILNFTAPYETYDPPVERMDRIRRDLINRIKELDKLPREQRERLAADYKRIKELIDNSYEIKDLLTWLWKHVLPLGRHHTKRTEQLQQLERLANNELYVRALEMSLKDKR